ncbi:MAG: hypothetical protein N3J91_13895 [Verrucomicrobiae bacterium]|nr:hypothetical protein [Verrucomicrobiae bacterium]
MKVTATKLAHDSKAVLDEVIKKGMSAVIERHGRPVAELRRKPGVSRAELTRRLKHCPFTKEETERFRRIIEAANDAYAHGD